MLVIRQEQVRALETVQVERFADELVLHIKKFAPIHFKLMGQEAIRKTIFVGLEESRKYGFTLWGSTRFFIEMMFMFGSSFCTDPQYQGIIGEALDVNCGDEMIRADHMYHNVMAYVDSASGPQHEYERLALSRAVQVRYENMIDLAERPASDLVEVLYEIYPQKVESLGEAAIYSLVSKACAMAAERGSSWYIGTPLFAGLMFTLGHGCFADPQYSWIAGTLQNTKSTEAVVILERVFRKFSIFLDRARFRLEMR